MHTSNFSAACQSEAITFDDVVRDSCRSAIREFGPAVRDERSPAVSRAIGLTVVATGVEPSRRKVYLTLLDVAECPDIEFGED